MRGSMIKGRINRETYSGSGLLDNGGEENARKKKKGKIEKKKGK